MHEQMTKYACIYAQQIITYTHAKLQMISTGCLTPPSYTKPCSISLYTLRILQDNESKSGNM
jgi:hypothetical protein